MVCRSVDGAHAVYTSSKTGSNIGREKVVCGNVVETLEESKGRGVQRLGGLEVGNLFDRNVTMANDESLVVDLLRGSIVIGSGIDKVTSLHVDNLHLDGESRVFHETFVSVLGEDELATRSLVEADDTTHRSLIARTSGDLLSVGEWDTIGKRTEAKVDAIGGIRYVKMTGWLDVQVVGRGKGANLSWIRVGTLSILLKTRGDDGRIECW